MNYLLLQPQGTLTKISIVPEGTEYQGEGIVWALRTGEQLLYVNQRMARDLKQMYLAGTYQHGALHVCHIDDAHQILSHRLGLSDKERYLHLKALAERSEQWHDLITQMEWGRMLWTLYGFLWTLVKGIFKVVAVMLIVPLLIRMFHKRR